MMAMEIIKEVRKNLSILYNDDTISRDAYNQLMNSLVDLEDEYHKSLPKPDELQPQVEDGCRIIDHAQEDPEWGNENAEGMCIGDCGECIHSYEVVE